MVSFLSCVCGQLVGCVKWSVGRLCGVVSLWAACVGQLIELCIEISCKAVWRSVSRLCVVVVGRFFVYCLFCFGVVVVCCCVSVF